MQSVDYSAFIRQAFNGDKGLAGAITKLPLEKKFRLQTVKEVSGFERGLHARYMRALQPLISCSSSPVEAARIGTHISAALNGCRLQGM